MKVIAFLSVLVGSTLGAPGYGAVAATRLETFSYGGETVEAKTAIPPVLEIKKAPVPIVRLNIDNDNAGTYKVDALSGDGTTQLESASLKDLGDKEGPVSVSRGSYSFVSDDGKTYKVDWTSDENGFHAVGDHLPVPPPIPAEIQKSLEQNKLEEKLSFPLGSFSYAETPMLSSYKPAALSVPTPAPEIRIQSFLAPAHLQY